VGIASGFVVAFLSICLAAFNYIPSFIINVMKFRYGVIGSLDDSEFQRYKEGPDHPTLVFGIAFWSQLYTAGLSFVVAGALGFSSTGMTRLHLCCSFLQISLVSW
jgi:hypothetical protein